MIKNTCKIKNKHDETTGKNIEEISDFIDDLLDYTGTYSHSLENTPVYNKLIQLYEDLNYRKNIEEVIDLCRALLVYLKGSVK